MKCNSCRELVQALEDILEGHDKPIMPQLLLNADALVNLMRSREEIFESRGIS